MEPHSAFAEGLAFFFPMSAETKMELNNDGSILTVFIETDSGERSVLGSMPMRLIESLDSVFEARESGRRTHWWTPEIEWKFERIAVASLFRSYAREMDQEEVRRMRVGKGDN